MVGAGGAANAATLTGNGNGNGSGAGWSSGVAAGSQDGTGLGRRAGSRGNRGSGKAGGGVGTGSRGAGSVTHANDIPAAIPGATITAEVADELAYMVQEEQLARDIYALAKAKYGDRIFTNINASETKHMAELRLLLDRYDVTDPTENAKAGVYANADLQALYNKLAAQVAVSRADAIQAGIAVEKADIADLKTALGMSAPADVKTILNNLLAGSNRHLAAFQRNA